MKVPAPTSTPLTSLPWNPMLNDSRRTYQEHERLAENIFTNPQNNWSVSIMCIWRQSRTNLSTLWNNLEVMIESRGAILCHPWEVLF